MRSASALAILLTLAVALAAAAWTASPVPATEPPTSVDSGEVRTDW